jgi:hypothetical protein
MKKKTKETKLGKALIKGLKEALSTERQLENKEFQELFLNEVSRALAFKLQLSVPTVRRYLEGKNSPVRSLWEPLLKSVRQIK